MEMKWYTIYTKPQTERRVLETLTNKKIEAYCPINRTGQNWNDKRFKEDVLFKSYVFVNVRESDLNDVKKISGVVNLVYWLGKPVIVSNDEIVLMKRFLNDHLNVSLVKTDISSELVTNTSLVETSFQHYTENSIGQNKIAKAVIPSLGFVLQAEAEQTNVTVISSENYYKKTKFTSYKLFNRVAEFNVAFRGNW